MGCATCPHRIEAPRTYSKACYAVCSVGVACHGREKLCSQDVLPMSRGMRAMA